MGELVQTVMVIVCCFIKLQHFLATSLFYIQNNEKMGEEHVEEVFILHTRCVFTVHASVLSKQ